MEETGVPEENHCCRSLTNYITLCCIDYTSLLAGFELITLMVIGTDCTDRIETVSRQ